MIPFHFFSSSVIIGKALIQPPTDENRNKSEQVLCRLYSFSTHIRRYIPRKSQRLVFRIHHVDELQKSFTLTDE